MTYITCVSVLGKALDGGNNITPVFKARLDIGLMLCNEGTYDMIIVQGGKRQGNTRTEAAAGLEYIGDRLDHGQEKLAEELSCDTITNALQLKAILTQRKIYEAAIVTSAFHLERTGYIFDMVFDGYGAINYVGAEHQKDDFEAYTSNSLEPRKLEKAYQFFKRLREKNISPADYEKTLEFIARNYPDGAVVLDPCDSLPAQQPAVVL